MKTAADLRSLAERRTWDKEIIVWLGLLESLLTHLPAGSVDIKQLDLLDLVSDSDLPEEDARTEFRRALDTRLKSLAPSPDKRCILIVTSTALLANFNTGLVGFFSWFCSDRAMVILHVDGIPEKLSLPSEFEFRATALLDYLVQPDHAKEIYA
ncbi:MAG: hypothetical protein WCS43_08710 [Verrucomicrobiota bacterium]